MKKLVETPASLFQFYFCTHTWWISNQVQSSVTAGKLHSVECLLLQPSDKKSAESVHPNLIWAASRRRARGGAGGGWTCRCTDTRTGKCSLNVSVTLRCHDVSRRDVVPTFKSAGQRKKKWKKETERKRDRGLMRQRSRRNKGMDKESLKGLMNSNRGWKNILKDEWRDRRTDGHSCWVWCCGPLCAPIDSVSPVLQLFVLCSVQSKS